MLIQDVAEPPSMPPLFFFEFLSDKMIQIPAVPVMGHGSVENFTGQGKLGQYFLHGQGRAGRASLVSSLLKIWFELTLRAGFAAALART